MKVKKSWLIWLITALISIVLSIFILGCGVSTVLASTNIVETPSQVQMNQQEPIDSAESAADETNNVIKEWLAVILGAADTTISAGLLCFIATRKKQAVSVTVNDAETQQKLETIHTENEKLKDVLVAMLTLEKGTLDVLKALYADNPNLDDKVRNIINEVSLNSEDIIKDVKDIFDKDNSEKVKQAFNAVSNIVLG